MTFKELTAVFTLYSNNFKVIHWGAIGPQFEQIHDSAERYYNMTNDDLDILAEMALRLDQNPATLREVPDILDKIEGYNFFIFDSFIDIDFDNFVKISVMMLKDICKCIEMVLKDEDGVLSNSENIGIRAELESIHNKYDLQYRYIITRKLNCEKA